MSWERERKGGGWQREREGVVEVDDGMKAARSFLSSKNMFLSRGDLVIVFCLICGRLLMSRKYIFLLSQRNRTVMSNMVHLEELIIPPTS